MLRIAFVGNENFFSTALCRWLSLRTDLRLFVSTSDVPWPHRASLRWLRIIRRVASGIRHKGLGRAIDEICFYLIYMPFLKRKERKRVRLLVDGLEADASEALEKIDVVRPKRIDDLCLIDLLKSLRLDAIFAVCTPVYFPKEIRQVPRFGVFVWHEGITPEYRGVYSPFWALLRKDYSRIGYTLLQMVDKVDAGPIYLQGQVEGAHFDSDWHSYLGHKAILDSLPNVDSFLRDLEKGRHTTIDRGGAPDGYYSYPTATGLIRIAVRRLLNRWGKKGDGAVEDLDSPRPGIPDVPARLGSGERASGGTK